MQNAESRIKIQESRIKNLISAEFAGVVLNLSQHTVRLRDNLRKRNVESQISEVRIKSINLMASTLR
jgi:hypothetical protein